jgi:hypothetical protein
MVENLLKSCTKYFIHFHLHLLMSSADGCLVCSSFLCAFCHRPSVIHSCIQTTLNLSFRRTVIETRDHFFATQRKKYSSSKLWNFIAWKIESEVLLISILFYCITLLYITWRNEKIISNEHEIPNKNGWPRNCICIICIFPMGEINGHFLCSRRGGIAHGP